MTGPKWSEMKKVTDKDLRRKKKEREALAAQKKVEQEKKNFLNKIIVILVIFILLVGGIVGYFIMKSKKEYEAKKKELSHLKIGAVCGEVQFKEKIGVWESLEKSYIAKNESLKTKINSNVEVFFDKNRVGRLLEKSILIIKNIIPHTDNSGVDVEAFLEKGAMDFKTSSNSSSLKIFTKFATLRVDPGEGGIFKIQIVKKGKKSLVRVAVSTGNIRVNYKNEPPIKIKSRTSVIIYENGKIKGPLTIIPGNESWF